MAHGKLVLVRHGESRMNELNLFTGWLDIPLSKRGIQEAHQVADHCSQFNYDAIFISKLERAHETLSIVLSSQKKMGVFAHEGESRYNSLANASKEFEENIIPVFMSEFLNERYYGELQGASKEAAMNKFGKEQLLKWRRGFVERPPGGESLNDVYMRIIPYFEQEIHLRIKQGKTVLVVGHGNTLRAVIKFLENIEDDQIAFVDLPTGCPLVYSCKRGLFSRIEGQYNFDRPLR